MSESPPEDELERADYKIDQHPRHGRCFVVDAEEVPSDAWQGWLYHREHDIYFRVTLDDQQPRCPPEFVEGWCGAYFKRGERDVCIRVEDREYDEV